MAAPAARPRAPVATHPRLRLQRFTGGATDGAKLAMFDTRDVPRPENVAETHGETRNVAEMCNENLKSR